MAAPAPPAWPPLQPSQWSQPNTPQQPSQWTQLNTPQPNTPQPSTAQQPSWSSPNATWQASEPSVEHARFIDPADEPYAGSEPWEADQPAVAVSASQATWQSGNPPWPQTDERSPAWATEATSTFHVPDRPDMDATVVNGFPAFQPPPLPPYGSQPPPYMVSALPPYAVAKRPGNLFSIAAFVLAAVSVLAFPIFAGPLALILGVVGLYRKEGLAKLATVLGIVGPVAGVALTMLIFGN
ncbi:MAG: hypothetical protein SYR96_26685 [Actinomycetota bacterium]|nr:hypothetical protein [Actinomycetota bacterium]